MLCVLIYSFERGAGNTAVVEGKSRNSPAEKKNNIKQIETNTKHDSKAKLGYAFLWFFYIYFFLLEWKPYLRWFEETL